MRIKGTLAERFDKIEDKLKDRDGIDDSNALRAGLSLLVTFGSMV